VGAEGLGGSVQSVLDLLHAPFQGTCIGGPGSQHLVLPAADEAEVAQSDGHTQGYGDHHESQDGAVAGDDPPGSVEHGEHSAEEQTIAENGELNGAQDGDGHAGGGQDHQEDADAAAPGGAAFAEVPIEAVLLGGDLVEAGLVLRSCLPVGRGLTDPGLLALEVAGLVAVVPVGVGIQRVHADTEERRDHQAEEDGEDDLQSRRGRPC